MLPTTVKIAFDLSGVDPNFFTLDDPVKGELDGIYVLAGDILQDVTDYVRAVSITRGRSRELDRYTTGQATLLLDNRARLFDPTDDDSPYVGQIKPRKAVEVVTGTDTVFAGNVQDWDYSYELSGDATSSVSCVDGFGILSRTILADVAVGTATTGGRVDDILDAASWPAGRRDIAAGTATLAAGTATGNALQYLQEVETSEAGDFYMSAAGVATFKGRGLSNTTYDAAVSYDSLTTAYSYPVPALTTDVVFTDETGDDNYVPYSSLKLQLGTDLLYNQVDVSFGTATITASDTLSQATYGVSSLQVNGNLLADAAQGTALSTYLVGRYAQPVVRFTEVAVDLHGLPTAVASKVLALDLADVVPVRFRPAYTGDRVEKVSVVEGISHDIGIDRHRITFRFSGTPGS
jgi:hypothetical protein